MLIPTGLLLSPRQYLPTDANGISHAHEANVLPPEDRFSFPPPEEQFSFLLPKDHFSFNPASIIWLPNDQELDMEQGMICKRNNRWMVWTYLFHD
jgi:hypothetical protein